MSDRPPCHNEHVQYVEWRCYYSATVRRYSKQKNLGKVHMSIKYKKKQPFNDKFSRTTWILMRQWRIFSMAMATCKPRVRHSRQIIMPTFHNSIFKGCAKAKKATGCRSVGLLRPASSFRDDGTVQQIVAIYLQPGCKHKPTVNYKSAHICVCIYHCARLLDTIQHKTVPTMFPNTLQTVITAETCLLKKIKYAKIIATLQQSNSIPAG